MIDVKFFDYVPYIDICPFRDKAVIEGEREYLQLIDILKEVQRVRRVLAAAIAHQYVVCFRAGVFFNKRLKFIFVALLKDVDFTPGETIPAEAAYALFVKCYARKVFRYDAPLTYLDH